MRHFHADSGDGIVRRVGAVIPMPTLSTATEWRSLVQTHNRLASHLDAITLDASRVIRVGPLGAVVLALAAARREHARLPTASWAPPRDEECARFLDEIAFPLYIRGTPDERAAAGGRPGTLEMRHVQVLDPVYLEGLSRLLVRNVPGTGESTSHLVQVCLSELVTNVRDHAQSAVGCFILARWFLRGRNVRIAIADAGATIPGVLGALPQYAGMKDHELLGAAVMTEGVSSRPGGRFGGLGLKTIREICTRRKGGILVISGNCRLEVRGSRAPDVGRMPVRFDGTAIEIDFQPQPEVYVGDEDVF
ncbi:MAG: sensor histidine kinase [Deltaproteobacteria bacterium]|nr:sensor histidine kinase [Deltaproteobacteria bacterium]